MKVLLVRDVERLGWLGDVVEVSAGYARNYLLPQGLAIIPTEANLRSLAEEKASRAEAKMRDRGRLEEVFVAVEGAEAVLAARANEQGVLFGSVGAREIAENLRAQGFEVADEMVQLAENIKQVGSHSVSLKFPVLRQLATKDEAVDLTATINVVVVAAGPPPLRGAGGPVRSEISEPSAASSSPSEEREDQNEQKESGPRAAPK